MSQANNCGRLGNQIFRNIALSIFIRKFDLFAYYYNYDIIVNKLGITLYNGSKIYSNDKTIVLDDENYFYLYFQDKLEYNVNTNLSYFQTKELSNLIYQYCNTDIIKENVMLHNKYKNRYNNNNDIYIHFRLDDVSRHSPKFEYFIKVIDLIKFKQADDNNNSNIYYSTDADENKHEYISKIKNIYPNIIHIDTDEVNTIHLASTCKYVILSQGTFSAIIGYLSFYSEVYTPEYDINNFWHGDIFTIENWYRIQY